MSLRPMIVELISGEELLKSDIGKGCCQRGTIELLQVIKCRVLGDLTNAIGSKPSVVEFVSTWACTSVFGLVHKNEIADMKFLSLCSELLVCWESGVIVE